MISVISGYGYVGRATELALLSNSIQPSIHDPALGRSTDQWERAAYHHICVPTPSSPDGSHDITALLDAIMHARLCGFKGITVVRSTIGPFEFDRLDLDPTRALVWPEFLRKATWQQDAVDPLVSVIGGEDCMNFLRDHPRSNITVIGDARTACMAKLAINSYLAVRTIITNDIRKACDSIGLNWMGVKQALESDPRLGQGYWEQPGPDGNFGFGGGCLPKDTLGMATLLEKTGLEDGYASWAITRNSTLRDH